VASVAQERLNPRTQIAALQAKGAGLFRVFLARPRNFSCQIAQKDAKLRGDANQEAADLFNRVGNNGNEGLTMKLIVAIIKPFKLDEVRQALTRDRGQRPSR